MDADAANAEELGVATPREAWVLGALGLAIDCLTHLLIGAGVVTLGPDDPGPRPSASVVVLVEPSAEHWSAARAKESPVVVVSQATDLSSVVAAVLRGAEAVVPSDSAPERLLNAISVVAQGGTLLAPLEARALVCAARAATQVSVLLTRRERQIIESIAGGASVKQTAVELGIAPKTVENLQGRLYRKLGVRNRAQAVARAHVLGLLDGPPSSGVPPA